MNDMDRNQHSVYSLYYHLIFVVKYRRKVIDDTISEQAREMFVAIGENYGITLEEWNHDMLLHTEYHVSILQVEDFRESAFKSRRESEPD